jgi:hypothetical protein
MLVTAGLVTASMAVSSPHAAAAVTIGQTGVPDTSCDIGDWAQPPVSDGTPYQVPSTGGIVNWTLTSWSHFANAVPEQRMKVKVYRQVSGLTYTVVGQDGPRLLVSDAPNTFTANFAVKAGDVLGMTTFTNNSGCGFGPPGEPFYFSELTDQPNGSQVTFFDEIGQRLNISAQLEPTSTFTLGRTRRNKKRGTATITVNVPNPGELTASGKGAKAAGLAAISKAVTGPGAATLVVKAKGKKKAKLNDTGKVKLGLTITFTPTGGAASTVPTKVKLKKKV